MDDDKEYILEYENEGIGMCFSADIERILEQLDKETISRMRFGLAIVGTKREKDEVRCD